MKTIIIVLTVFTYTSCLTKKKNNKYYVIDNIVLYRCCDDLRAISTIKEELIIEVKSNDSNINENSKLMIKVNHNNCRPLILQGKWDKIDSTFCSYKNTIVKNDTFIHRFKIDLDIVGISLINIIKDYQCLWSMDNQFHFVADMKKHLVDKPNKITVTYLYNDKTLTNKDSFIIKKPFMPDDVPGDF
jgi:hypothetical protein